MTNEEALQEIDKICEACKNLKIDECDDCFYPNAVKAIKAVDRLKEKYHNFCGYDLEKCIKYGHESNEQLHDSYTPMAMYEIASELEDVLDD